MPDERWFISPTTTTSPIVTKGCNDKELVNLVPFVRSESASTTLNIEWVSRDETMVFTFFIYMFSSGLRFTTSLTPRFTTLFTFSPRIK